MLNHDMVRKSGAVLLAAAAIFGLNACAESAKPEAMVAAPAAGAAPFPQTLQHAMCVRAVTGGQKTNPLWASKVDNDGFKAALASSLDGAGLTAPSTACAFPIDVNLLGLSQPAAGFDMTVTSHVNYKVYDAAGQPLLLETLDTPYTAKMADSFVGSKRLELANEGAIRTSITAFFDKLRATKPAPPKP